MSQDKTVPQACKEVGFVDQTYYRRRREYGGVQLEQARKLKDMQKGERGVAPCGWPNSRLRNRY